MLQLSLKSSIIVLSLSYRCFQPLYEILTDCPLPVNPKKAKVNFIATWQTYTCQKSNLFFSLYELSLSHLFNLSDFKNWYFITVSRISDEIGNMAKHNLTCLGYFDIQTIGLKFLFSWSS